MFQALHVQRKFEEDGGGICCLSRASKAKYFHASKRLIVLVLVYITRTPSCLRITPPAAAPLPS